MVLLSWWKNIYTCLCFLINYWIYNCNRFMRDLWTCSSVTQFRMVQALTSPLVSTTPHLKPIVTSLVCYPHSNLKLDDMSRRRWTRVYRLALDSCTQLKCGVVMTWVIKTNSSKLRLDPSCTLIIPRTRSSAVENFESLTFFFCYRFGFLFLYFITLCAIYIFSADRYLRICLETDFQLLIFALS